MSITHFLKKFHSENIMANLIDELSLELQEAVIWVNENFINIEVPADNDRIQIASGCFDIAIEHQSGMYALCKINSYALMFASQRLIFDALLRGLWIQYCATDAEIEAFKNGRGPTKLLRMTTQIENTIGDDLLPLEQYRDRLEKHLHDFTHTGYQHIARRHNGHLLGPNYPQHEVCQVINFAALMGLQAAARMATLAGKDDLAAATHKKMVEYGRRYVELREKTLSTVKASAKIQE